MDLPLSSSLLPLASSHPLVELLLKPVLLRLSWIEGTVLSNASLLRRLNLSPSSIDALALVAIAAFTARFKGQWRAMLAVLGMAEATYRSVRLLQLLERSDSEAEGRDDERGKRRKEREKQEIKHVLCFWLFYSLLALGQSLRATSASTSFLVAPKPISQRVAAFNRRLRSLVQPLTTRYPSLAFFNAPPRLAPRQPRTFPQPRPLIPVTLPRPPLPVKWLNTEVKYRLFKVILLWTALRRDGWGASALWDWVFGPVLSVRRNRREEKGLGRRTRRVRLVLEEEEDMEGEGYDDGTQSPRQDVFADSETSSSTTTSPSYSRKPHYDPNASFSSGASESPYHHSDAASSSSTAFPTPNVPFRLTSSSHPIISRGPQNDHSGRLAGRLESPTPIRTAAYDVEDLLSGGKDGERMVESWGASGDWGPHE